MKPPPDFTFFTDRDLGPTDSCDVVTILRDAGLNVVPHGSEFRHDAEDDVWLSHCGEKGWVALTKDKRISYTPLAKQAIMENGVRLFVLIGTHSHPDLARNFVNTSVQIQEFLEENPGPFIARVYLRRDRFEKGQAGKVKMWLTKDEWEAER